MTKDRTTNERPATTQRKQHLLDQICAYVDANLERRITLQMVADAFDVSISSVTQLFQNKAGITFHQFLTQRRMAAAEALIRQGVPLEEVGKHIGYTDHSSFYRAFMQYFGCSPRHFKRKLNQD
jgi:AraC-like DNA-binding protein